MISNTINLQQIISNHLFTDKLNELPKKDKCIINTINPHSYCVAKKDKVFADALLRSDILLPDGVGIVLAVKILTGKKIRKIAGADIHQYLIEQANLKKQKIFYLGASQNTLDIINNKIKKEFPNIKVSSFSPPFKETFSDDDTKKMIKMVNAFRPDILFVGMTAPKQEKWVYLNKDKIDTTIVVSIGAVFDFYAEIVKRPSKFWISLGLEWLPRFLNEPKRLWKRNFISTPSFLLEIIKTKTGSM